MGILTRGRLFPFADHKRLDPVGALMVQVGKPHLEEFPTTLRGQRAQLKLPAQERPSRADPFVPDVPEPFELARACGVLVIGIVGAFGEGVQRPLGAGGGVVFDVLVSRGDAEPKHAGLGWPCPRISAIIADFKSVHATYAAYMQPCDRDDPSVPERPRTADGPVSEEKWLFGEFGESCRTVANVDYC
jgi:hypothetical protein